MIRTRLPNTVIVQHIKKNPPKAGARKIKKQVIKELSTKNWLFISCIIMVLLILLIGALCGLLISERVERAKMQREWSSMFPKESLQQMQQEISKIEGYNDTKAYQMSRLIHYMSGKWRVDKWFVFAMIKAESYFQEDAFSVDEFGNIIARGLLQVTKVHFKPGDDPFDPYTNLDRGLEYLNECLQMSNGNARHSVYRWNAGTKCSIKNPPEESQNLWLVVNKYYRNTMRKNLI